MHRRLVEFLLLIFLAVIGVNWPELPYNARLADLVFIPLAILVLTLPGTRWSWHWSDMAVAAYLLGALPAIVVSENAQQSTLAFVRELYLAVVFVVFAIAARRGFAPTAGKGLALGGALLSIAGLAFVARQLIGAAPWPPMGEVMPLPYIGNALRLRGLTASEAMFACVLTAATPFAIVLCRSDRARYWCGATAVMIAAASLTFSHALAGFVVALLIAMWPALSTWPKRRGLAIGAVAVVVLGLNFAATVAIRSVSYGSANYADASQYHYAVDERQTQIGGATVIYNVMSYARIKQIAWRTFVEHPIAGIGLDRFHSATMRAYSEGRLPQLYSQIDPHSTLLGRLAECGVIGGATLLLLWWSWAMMARKSMARSVLGYAAAAGLAGLVVGSLNADVMNFRFLWVLAGLLRGLYDANGMVTASGDGASAADGTR